MNRYLERRGRRDYRNPYGSRGGYVSSSRSGRRDNMKPNMMNYYEDPYMEYDTPYMQGRQDYGYNRDYNRDYNSDYGRDYKHMDKEYHEELKEWAEKLKRKDKFSMPYEQVIQQAESLGVRFREYDELEYYITYLMLVSDYGDLINDPTIMLKMAKAFLEDDDIKVSPSEKLCIYFYQIVLGEDD